MRKFCRRHCIALCIACDGLYECCVQLVDVLTSLVLSGVARRYASDTASVVSVRRLFAAVLVI